MSVKIVGRLRSAQILLGLVASQLALGQQANTPAVGEEDKLGEIVVTARRVEERAQDVPISMTIFNQSALSDRNIVTAGDLAAFTPSMSVDNQFGNDVTSFSIRGFVQLSNTTPSVATYFADAVVPRGGEVGEPAGSGVAPGSFFDLQNVQVLKGPQGTLFGRNTDGGAVLLVPKKPTADFEGYVEGTYGNFDTGQVQAVLNAPLGDRVRIRLAVNHETRNGYEDNISGIGPQDFSNLDYTAARLSVVADITSNLENYTVSSYNLSNNNGVLPQLFACNQTQPLAALVCPPALQAVQASGNNYAVLNQLSGANSYLKQYQIVNTTTWRPSDTFTVKNVANWGLLITALNSSLFGAYLDSPFGSPFFSATSTPTALGAKTTDQYTWSDELQLSGKLFDDKLSWQGGGYIERSGPQGDLTGSLSANFLACQSISGFLCAGPGLIDDDTSTIHYNDLAGFAQATYAILPQLRLTGGVRYTSDSTSAVIHQTNYGPQAFPPYGPGGPAIPPVCQVPTLSPAAGCAQYLEEKSHAPTYLLGLDYNPVGDVLVYGKYSRGYRQGGVATFALPGFQVYAPEFVNAFELGEKTTFSGPVSGTFDVTAHYNRLTNQQLLAAFFSPTSTPASGIANAGRSRIWGVEVETTLVPIQRVTLGLSYSYLNTELQTAFVANPPPGQQVIFPTTKGNVLPFSPKNKFAASASYRLPLPEGIGAVSLDTNFTYTSSLLTSDAAGPYATLGAYGLLGMNLHWNEIMHSPIDAELFVTNLTNRLYYNNISTLYESPLGIDGRFLGEPRMYGLRVRVRFK